MLRARRLLFCLLLALAGGLPVDALAAQVLLLLSEESSAFSEAAEAIVSELRSAGHRTQSLSLPLRSDESAALAGNALIITLGTLVIFTFDPCMVDASGALLEGSPAFCG